MCKMYVNSMSLRTGIFLALCCLFLSLHAQMHRINRHGRGPSSHVPPRCRQNTVTPVSCEDIDAPDSLLPHPDDCELFYYCEHSYMPPVCRQCPGGLHFNPSNHVCDWPEQAGCQLNSTSTTPAADSTVEAQSYNGTYDTDN